MSMFESEDRTCAKCGQEWEALAFWGAEMNCHDCNSKAWHEKIAELNAERPYRIETIGGASPTQATGEWVDGQRFYFRARYGDYTLEVDPVDAVMGTLIDDGDDPSGGYMEIDDVVAILDAAATKAVRPCSR